MTGTQLEDSIMSGRAARSAKGTEKVNGNVELKGEPLSPTTPILQESSVSSAPATEAAAAPPSIPPTSGTLVAAAPVPEDKPKPKSLADFLKQSAGSQVSIVPGASPLSSAPTVTSQSAPATPLPPVSSSYAGNKLPVPEGLHLFNTRSLTSGYLHALIYGETDARKSTVAATFGKPENTRIILVRRPEQLIPLRDLGYEAAHVETLEALRFSLLHPEQLWPEWATMPDRTLVLDDFTQAKEMFLEGNEMRATTDAYGNVTGYKEIRDPRQVHKAAKDDMYDIMQHVFKQEQNFIGTALAQIYLNNITHEETLSPDLPPSMNRMLTTEFEFVFFIDKKTWKFVTTQKLEAYTGTDEKGKKVTQNRFLFGKHKLPIALEGKGLIMQDEVMDLRGIWETVKRGLRA